MEVLVFSYRGRNKRSNVNSASYKMNPNMPQTHWFFVSTFSGAFRDALQSKRRGNILFRRVMNPVGEAPNPKAPPPYLCFEVTAPGSSGAGLRTLGKLLFRRGKANKGTWWQVLCAKAKAYDVLRVCTALLTRLDSEPNFLSSVCPLN